MRYFYAFVAAACAPLALATQVNFYYDTSCKDYASTETSFINGYNYGGADGARGIIYVDHGSAYDWIVIDGDSDLPADKPANGHCVGTTKGICVNLKCDANESDPYY